ncbi:hypothetical protein Ciccas_008837 [Cichlidogyrus casuarinus]|uniref:Uncharacterized protein n=1 Tax=Cichlidogyrus casuarinus TaxID=1844966 RepID=A0ABD2PYW5_9PLAT
MSICFTFKQSLDEHSDIVSPGGSLCLLINSLACDTALCARQYLVCFFVFVFHWVMHGPKTRGCCHRENPTVFQSMALFVVTHSLPWALAAGSALAIALQPIFEANVTPSAHFFFRGLEQILDRCEPAEVARAEPQRFIAKVLLLLPVSLLVLIPSVAVIVTSSVFLSAKTEKCEQQKIPIGVLLFFTLLSPTITAIWDLKSHKSRNEEGPTILIARLLLVQFISDALVFAYIINNFRISYATTISSNPRQTMTGNTYESKDENFAEYPPDLELNFGGCIPCQSDGSTFPTLLSACVAPR